MSLRSTHEGLNARDQFVLMEWLSHIIVGAEPETLDLVLDIIEAREKQDRRLYLRTAHRAQHFKARHVRQVQIKDDDVIVIDLAQIDAFLRDHLDHIPLLVEKYKKAILASAFSGELTRKWRDTNRQSSAWDSKKTETIITNIVAGKNLRCEERPPTRN